MNINTQPAIDGIYHWKCEKCEVEWREPASEYDFVNTQGKLMDRTMDFTNWPVFCEKCAEEFYKEINRSKVKE